MSQTDQSIRRKRYKRLRVAGFSYKEANKYKDLSDARIDEVIKYREEASKLLDKSREQTISEILEAIMKHDKSGKAD